MSTGYSVGSDRQKAVPPMATMEGLGCASNSTRAKHSLRTSAGLSFVAVTKGAAGICSVKANNAAPILECRRWFPKARDNLAQRSTVVSTGN